MKYLRAIAAAALAFLAVLAAVRIGKETTRAKAWHAGDEDELQKDIVSGTHDAKVRALRAKAHLDTAAKEREKLQKRLDQQAALHDELETGFDRFQSRARRGMRGDT